MSVWFLVFAILAVDGSTAVQIMNAPTSQKNTEETCRASGEVIAKNIQKQFGDKVKVVWGCTQVTKEEFDRALPPSI